MPQASRSIVLWLLGTGAVGSTYALTSHYHNADDTDVNAQPTTQSSSSTPGYYDSSGSWHSNSHHGSGFGSSGFSGSSGSEGHSSSARGGFGHTGGGHGGGHG